MSIKKSLNVLEYLKFSKNFPKISFISKNPKEKSEFLYLALDRNGVEWVGGT